MSYKRGTTDTLEIDLFLNGEWQRFEVEADFYIGDDEIVEIEGGTFNFINHPESENPHVYEIPLALLHLQTTNCRTLYDQFCDKIWKWADKNAEWEPDSDFYDDRDEIK